MASKFAVGQDYEWCRERQDIEDAFNVNGVSLFRQYVEKGEVSDAVYDEWYQPILDYRNKKNK